MSHIFRIHKTGPKDLRDWGALSTFDANSVASIDDSILTSSLNIIGTSFPTPLARMHLFDTAFKIVNNHLTNSDPKLKSKINPIYSELISDCLDLLQFLFIFGNDENISYKIWNVAERIEKLSQSKYPEHILLGDALSTFFKSDSFDGFNEVVLIYWEEKLVGGTSPFTIVYSSPNWKRITNENGWYKLFKFPTGDTLFYSNPANLIDRNEDFKEYIYWYISAYQNGISRHFYDYIYYVLDPIFRINKKYYNQHSFLSNYEKIYIEQDSELITLNSNGCQLGVNKTKFIGSDFEIYPSVDFYKEGTAEQITPLALINCNLKWKYLGENLWNPLTIVPDNRNIPVQKRKLPDLSGYKYPYLTIGDFFEDKLFEMPFGIDTNKFVTLSKANKYLLPIRKEYFKYFTIKDLKVNLSVKNDGDKVIYYLNIPLVKGKEITFKKEYTNREKVIQPLFNIGIFPFYKILENDELNRYCIFFGYDKHLNINARFFKTENINSNISCIGENRTKGDGSFVSRYFHLENISFDFIEVNVNDASACIIPLFFENTEDSRIFDFYFAIDIGTFNTHVVFSNSNDLKNPKPFEIKEIDRQMYFLSEMKTDILQLNSKVMEGMGNDLMQVYQLSNVEFIPSFINPSMNNKFPISTIICEHQGHQNKWNLFSSINIGFGIESIDINANRENIYYTNVKTNLLARTHRMEAFIEELLWLIKNKCVLNKGKLDPKIIWTYSQTMSENEVSVLETIWRKKAIKIFGEIQNLDISKCLESVARYYDVAVYSSQDTINIHIDEDTSDILFVDRKNGKTFFTSFRFADNDIWGDGIAGKNKKDNGFLNLAIAKTKDHKLLMLFDFYKKNGSNLNSVDLFKLLFKDDQQSNINNFFLNEMNFKSVACIHLAAIIYHISQIILDKGMGLPKQIYFTGIGSRNLNLICNNSYQLKLFIIFFFEKFTGLKALSTIEVNHFENPKENTANGALKSFIKVLLKTPEAIVHSGIDRIGSNDPFKELEVNSLRKNSTSIKNNFLRFLDCLREKDVVNFLESNNFAFFTIKNTEFKFDMLDYLEAHSELGLNEFLLECTQRYEKAEVLKETAFFWNLKEGLYLLTKELYKNFTGMAITSPIPLTREPLLLIYEEANLKTEPLSITTNIRDEAKELKILKKMFEDGLISEIQYTEKVRELLDKI